VNVMHGLWPGVVYSYDPDKRTCRVSIEGLTAGSGVLPEAVFCNPLGDRAGDTEIRILSGDLVWLMFECGDPRFPVIMGYRTPRTGNPKDWRRWHHKNIELIAESTFLITLGATTITVTDGLVDINATDTRLRGNLMVDGNTLIKGTGQVLQTLTVTQNIMGMANIMAVAGISAGANIIATGQVADAGGTKTMADLRTKFNTHHHTYTSGGGTTSLPDQTM
jgi:hypothetical protein